jgi:hypothetical protein
VTQVGGTGGSLPTRVRAGTGAPAADPASWIGSPASDLPKLTEVSPFPYELGPEIGGGGMGRIHIARDRRLGRVVALKVLPPGHDGLAERFRREACLTARLEHPTIVSVHEAGYRPGGEPFYAMRHVSGRELEEIVAEAGTFAKRLALVPRVLAVADALAYAHAKGIIHRDLKPANVMIGEFGETVVLDWGLAKTIGEPEDESRVEEAAGPMESKLTMAGQVMGTPAYMPPEQAAGASVDERADVYALGAMLYRVLAGQPPYQGTTSAQETLERVMAEPPRPLGEMEPTVPPELSAIVGKAMARDRAARYASARELAEDLRRYTEGQMVQVHRYTAAQLVWRWARKYRAAVTVGLVASVVLALVVATSVREIVRQRDRAQQAQQQAEETAVSFLEEQGRIQHLSGQGLAAVMYLSEAYRRGARSAPLRMLLRQAMRPLEARVRREHGHRGMMRMARFSPDGLRILTNGIDGTVRVWDTESGRELARLDAHSQDARTAVFSPDGRRIATCGVDQSTKLWDSRSFRLLDTLEGHTRPLSSAFFSPDGRMLITSSEDRTARLWDVESGSREALLTGSRPAFSPDSRRVATASEADGTVSIWDTLTGRLVLTLARHAGTSGLGRQLGPVSGDAGRPSDMDAVGRI